jgi:hypothetical protein
MGRKCVEERGKRVKECALNKLNPHERERKAMNLYFFRRGRYKRGPRS